MPRIETFFNSGLKTLPEILTRLSAIDGISFTSIGNSQNLQSAFRAQGYIIPKSHQTVCDLVMKYFEKVKKQVIGSLKEIILTSGKFSLTFNEYT